MTDDYTRAHESRKDTRRREAEERQVIYDEKVQVELNRLYLDHDGEEDAMLAEAKRNVNAISRHVWQARKESK